MNTRALDADDLCNLYGDKTGFDMVMSHWRRTHSPLVHLFKELDPHKYQARQSFQRLSDQLLWTKATPQNHYLHGLPPTEALRVCREMLRLGVDKLTVQINDPDVIEMRRRIKVGFVDQLGVVGMNLKS